MRIPPVFSCIFGHRLSGREIVGGNVVTEAVGAGSGDSTGQGLRSPAALENAQIAPTYLVMPKIPKKLGLLRLGSYKQIIKQVIKMQHKSCKSCILT